MKHRSIQKTEMPKGYKRSKLDKPQIFHDPKFVKWMKFINTGEALKHCQS
jgi:hypothetical protein